MHPAAKWYASHYGDRVTGRPMDGVDDRCWDVLESLGQIYNLTDDWLPDGGLQAWGGGALCLFTSQTYATTDWDELTRLVLAAHQHGCRVQISSTVLLGERDGDDWEASIKRYWTIREDDRGDTLGPYLVIAIHPRQTHDGPWAERPDSTHFHPKLTDLIDRASALQSKPPELDLEHEEAGNAMAAPVPMGSQATSVKAAQRISLTAGSTRVNVLQLLRDVGGEGLTNSQIEDLLGLKRPSGSNRRLDLESIGCVEQARNEHGPITRIVDGHGEANVYRITTKGILALDRLAAGATRIAPEDLQDGAS